MFKIVHQSQISQARLGIINTPHGAINTPFFMPDATRAVLKMCSNEELAALGLPAMVVNTFHLYLQPGTDLIKQAGGVHRFMDWDKPLLSDSGGFQVFSLLHKNPQMGRIRDKEVIFKSPLDGSEHILSPEKSIQIQFDLGTDMVVVLDDCPPHDVDDAKMKAAIDHTIAWARRCRNEFDQSLDKLGTGKRPLLFGVVQGGLNEDLRKYCAEELIKIGFDGYGFGARPVDAQGNFVESILKVTADAIPADKIRFGLGIGTPEDIVRCVKLGWDMFDCVIPTREGRHGRLFYFRNLDQEQTISGAQPLSLASDVAKRPISQYRAQRLISGDFYSSVNIKNTAYKNNFESINPHSAFKPLRKYSKAYLHHLFKINDPLGQRLASLHNLEFYKNLMDGVRAAIKSGEL